MSRRPHPRHVVGNWNRSDLTLAQKIRLAMKNQAIKLRTGSSCCGNHGEPGC